MKCSSLLFCIVMLPACTSGEPPRESTNATSAAITVAGSPGFSHVANKSRFSPGSGLTTRVEHGFLKSVGSDGVFAAHESSGMVVGIPNANSTEAAKAPFSLDPTVHGAAVRQYLIGAGLPETEISEVLPYATMTQTATGSAVDGAPALHHYTTVIRRQIHGISVPDSIAYARLNSDGVAVEEGVHWPAISSSTVASALALQAAIIDDGARARFLASLPFPSRQSRVVIRHTPGLVESSHEEGAFVDVDDVVARTTRHFDAGGREFVFKHEVDAAHPVIAGGDAKH